ncbi:MAG: C40 family peptidase [Candidatus Yonathbacteria bacterium]|nr:C40 family peptidase [Candidatus Yonathbacteria bacterium]
MNIPVSYKTLARYLDGIPNPSELSEILLTHICEVEGEERRGDDTIFELKITPDRGDLLSYRGIAREVAVHNGATLKQTTNNKQLTTDIGTTLRVSIEDSKACPRYIGRVVEGVDDRQPPAWLREALEASGQRSINAIVDVTNFVMLELGQPMHAFDIEKMRNRRGTDAEQTLNEPVNIIVRMAVTGEKIITLDNKEVLLNNEILVISNGYPRDSASSLHDSAVLAIAGVKGGAYAGVGEKVNTIVLESATFDATLVRKASDLIGIRTDSSRRFEHRRAPELAPIAMKRATELLLEIFPDARAGEMVDVYPRPANAYRVSISPNDIAQILGITYYSADLEYDLERLGFQYERIEDPRQKIVTSAKELAGTPYFHGASVLYDAPHKFDCSGFTCSLFLEAGIKIPRMGVDQYVFGEEVSLDDIMPGDLVFSVNEGSQVYFESIEWMKGTKVPAQGIDHVGVYVGDGMIAHASRYNKSVGPEGGVLIEKLSESSRFKTVVGVRRICESDEERFSVIAPAERFDIRIPADLAEEVARLRSYDSIPSLPIAQDGFVPAYNDMYGAMLRARNTLDSLGFSEIFTYAFRKKGNVELANPMAEGINFLRNNLVDGMQDALVFNARNAPLLGIDEILMFEIGTVFFAPEKEATHISVGVSVTKAMKQSKKEEREHMLLESACEALETALGAELSWIKEGSVCECALPFYKTAQKEYEALIPSSATKPYRRISAYPFVLRDIAMWATEKITQDEILSIIRAQGGELLVRDRLFDVFTKDSKTSYAFNLVFQSYERTLSDIDVNEVMARITDKLSAQGLEVR